MRLEGKSGTCPRVWGIGFALLVLNSGSKKVIPYRFSGYMLLYLHIGTFFSRMNLFVIDLARVIVLLLST